MKRGEKRICGFDAAGLRGKESEGAAIKSGLIFDGQFACRDDGTLAGNNKVKPEAGEHCVAVLLGNCGLDDGMWCLFGAMILLSVRLRYPIIDARSRCVRLFEWFLNGLRFYRA